MQYVFTIIVVSLLLPVLLSYKKTYKEGDTSIVFEFSKGLKVFMLLGLLIFIAITVAITIVSIVNDDKSAVIGVVIFGLFSIGMALLCLTLNNKRFVYENGTFFYKSTFGKNKQFMVGDLKEAIYVNTDGTKLILNDGRKIKFDMQMSNFDKLQEILEKNNIIYKDSHGNVAPKGW